MKSYIPVTFICDQTVPFRTAGGMEEALARFFQISKRLNVSLSGNVGNEKPAGARILSLNPAGSRPMDINAFTIGFLVDTQVYSMRHQFMSDLDKFFQSIGVEGQQVSSGNQVLTVYLSTSIQWQKHQYPVVTERPSGGQLPTAVLHRLMQEYSTPKEKEELNNQRYSQILEELSGRL